MTSIVGIFELMNDTGDTITDASCTVEVGSAQSGKIFLPSLSNGTKSLSTQFYADEGDKIDWDVAFTDSTGKNQCGTVMCKCTVAASSDPVLVTLKSGGGFTVTTPKSGTCHGTYKES